MTQKRVKEWSGRFEAHSNIVQHLKIHKYANFQPNPSQGNFLYIKAHISCYIFRLPSSPYFAYKTISHILDTFTDTPAPVSKDFQGKIVERIHGQSFLKPIPENTTCSESGVPESQCACYLPIKVDARSRMLKEVGEAAVEHLNKKNPKECARLKLDRILGGALREQMDRSNRIFIVEFSTQPGGFIFEATVSRKIPDPAPLTLTTTPTPTPTSSPFKTKYIQRLSSLTTDVSCVKGDEKLYCLCL